MRLILLCLVGLSSLAQASDTTKGFSVELIDTDFPVQPKNLRTRSAAEMIGDVQYHRKLETFTIPYSLLWRIEVGNGYPKPDRQPSDEEYSGVQQATVDWFDVAHAAYYANDEGITFISTACDLMSGATTWEAGADYPHKIQLECYADFEANAIADLPTNIDFILSINEDYDFEDFTRNYLWKSNPPENLFRYSQRVGYTLTDNGPVAPSNPSGASNTTSAPVLMPTPSPVSNLPELSGQYMLPFAIVWDMAVGQTSVDREPTQDAYDGMVDATVGWLTDETNVYYADQAGSFALSEVLVTLDPEPTWSPGNQYPHQISQDCFAIFKANSLSDVPTVIEFLQYMSANYDVTNFIENYLRVSGPEDSILREVTLVRYTSSTTSPAGPANLGTPTMPVPTMPAPASGAPAPTPETLPATPTTPVSTTSGPTPGVPQSTPGTLPATPTTPVSTTSAPTPGVPPPTPGTPSPTPEPPIATPEAPISSPTAPTVPAPAPTRDVGPFPTNPPVATGDGVVVLETMTVWKYAIGFAIPDRQPFIAEYEGYIDSTEAWLTKIYTDKYNSNDDTAKFEYLNSEIESAEYDSLADFSHIITLKTQYVFTVDEGQPVPTTNELLMVISDASLMDYMLNHLHESEPRFNIFTGTKSVTWTAAPMTPTAPVPTAPVPAPTRGVPAPAPTMAASVPAPTTAAPVPAPTTSAPAPVPAPTMDSTPVENGGDADLSNLDSVRIFMTLELDINAERYDSQRRIPTSGEWEGLLMATKKFLTDSFSAYYAGNTASQFVGLQQVKWIITAYEASLELPYNGDLQFDVAFLDGAELQPNSAYWEIINTFDFKDYLREYVWVEYPYDSIFHYASELNWNFVDSM